jgi:hypothetical protein
MKTALHGLMLAALLAAGCMPKAPYLWPDDDATPVEPVAPPQKHTPPVRADQVTQENAAEKARELEAELQNDSKAPQK